MTYCSSIRDMNRSIVSMSLFAFFNMIRLKLGNQSISQEGIKKRNGTFLKRGKTSLKVQPSIFQSSKSLALGRVYFIKLTLLPPPRTRPEGTTRLLPATKSLGEAIVASMVVLPGKRLARKNAGVVMIGLSLLLSPCS